MTKTPGSKVLNEIELFQGLSQSEQNKIIKKLHIQKIRKGTNLFNEGDPGDKLYIIIEGEINISIESKQGGEIILATIGAGDYFGEMALLTDSKRSATAKAIVTCICASLSKEDFLALVQANHLIAIELSKVLSLRLSVTNKLLLRQKTSKQTKKIKEFPTELQNAFKEKMTPIEVKVNDSIFKEGDSGDKMYFIQEGKILISIVNTNDEEVTLAVLNKGAYFGEMALLTNTPRTANAKAYTNCKLLYMGKDAFDILLNNHHVIALELVKVLTKRLSSTNKIVSKRMNTQLALVIHHNEHREHVNHLIKYIKTISSKQIITIRNKSIKDIQSEYKKHDNAIVLGILKEDIDQSSHEAEHVFNFIKHHPDQTYIKHDATLKHMEFLARVIAKKTVGIALSSGTASGLSHLGVMKVMQENDIPIDYISGTSGGALYGSAFAFGYDFDAIYKVFSAVYKKNLMRLWDPSLKMDGIFKGNKIINRTIKKLIGNKNIEDSVIPFAAVSTDLYSGKEMIMTTGNLLEAVRASLSIPIIFAPVRTNNLLLVDGVVTTPIPISALKHAAMDIRVAVYVSEPEIFQKRRPNLMQIFLRSRNISADFIAEGSLDNAHVLIKPDVKNIKQFDYNKIDDLILSGEKAAKKALPRIKRLLKT